MADLMLQGTTSDADKSVQVAQIGTNSTGRHDNSTLDELAQALEPHIDIDGLVALVRAHRR